MDLRDSDFPTEIGKSQNQPFLRVEIDVHQPRSGDQVLTGEPAKVLLERSVDALNEVLTILAGSLQNVQYRILGEVLLVLGP
jgi:hypothetical protein